MQKMRSAENMLSKNSCQFYPACNQKVRCKFAQTSDHTTLIRSQTFELVLDKLEKWSSFLQSLLNDKICSAIICFIATNNYRGAKRLEFFFLNFCQFYLWENMIRSCFVYICTTGLNHRLVVHINKCVFRKIKLFSSPL